MEHTTKPVPISTDGDVHPETDAPDLVECTACLGSGLQRRSDGYFDPCPVCDGTMVEDARLLRPEVAAGARRVAVADSAHHASENR